MKKSVGEKQFSKIPNRLMYSLIAFVLVLIACGVVYATAGAIPNPGHSLAQLQPCSNGETLLMAGGVWTCSAPSSQWSTSGNNLYYDSGNVGVGTTSPGTTLDVGSSTSDVIRSYGGFSGNLAASISGTGAAAYLPNGFYSPTGVTNWIYGYTYFGAPSGDTINFRANTITGTGTITASAFYYSSDKSLKTNIQPLQNSLENLQKLQGVSFNWKSDGTKSIGLIAQDVEKVYPEIVSTNSNGTKSVDYAKLVAVLIESVKEQQKQIDDLKIKCGE